MELNRFAEGITPEQCQAVKEKTRGSCQTKPLEEVRNITECPDDLITTYVETLASNRLDHFAHLS